MRLQSKLVVIPAAFVIVLFISTSVFSIYNYRKTSIDMLNNNQVLLVNSVTETVDEYINKHRGIIEHLSTHECVKNSNLYDEINVETRGAMNNQALIMRKLN